MKNTELEAHFQKLKVVLNNSIYLKYLLNLDFQILDELNNINNINFKEFLKAIEYHY